MLSTLNADMIDFSPRPDSALLILGHGSTENTESSASVRNYADTLGRRGVFAEVHCAFWKEEPHFTRILEEIDSRTIYVVPAFISEGYFTRQIIPQELGLGGRTTFTGDHTLPLLRSRWQSPLDDPPTAQACHRSHDRHRSR